MQNPLTSTDRAWADDLVLALRLRDVPGPRIGEILAEVQSHVAETGEDPRSAFGPPKEYAAQVAGALGLQRTPLRVLLSTFTPGVVALAGGAGVSGFLLADALWDLGAGDPSWFGLPAGAVALVAGLVFGWCMIRPAWSFRGDTTDAVRDPRTGADMVPFAPWRVALLIALPVLALAGMLLGGYLTR